MNEPSRFAGFLLLDPRQKLVDTGNVIRIPREYKVGLLFFLLGCCAYAAIHIHHFRSHTEHRIEVTSFALIGFAVGQLSFAWAVRRNKRHS